MAAINNDMQHGKHNESIDPAERERSRKWDNAHMSPEVGKANIENERRNLNADQEKRAGSSNPGRDRRR